MRIEDISTVAVRKDIITLTPLVSTSTDNKHYDTIDVLSLFRDWLLSLECDVMVSSGSVLDLPTHLPGVQEWPTSPRIRRRSSYLQPPSPPPVTGRLLSLNDVDQLPVKLPFLVTLKDASGSSGMM